MARSGTGQTTQSGPMLTVNTITEQLGGNDFDRSSVPDHEGAE